MRKPIGIGIGQAGTEIDCTACGKQMAIGRLSRLRESVAIQKTIESPTAFQFCIRGMMLSFLPFAALAFAIGEFGLAVSTHIAAAVFSYGVFVVICASFIQNLEEIKASFWD